MLRLALAGAVGAFVGWLITEPFFNEHSAPEGQLLLSAATWFGVVYLCVGVAFGVAEGLSTRVWQKIVTKGLVGGAIGFVGGFVGGMLAQGVYSAMRSGQPVVPVISSAEFYRLMLARAIGWGLAGCFAGPGQGLAIGSWRKAVYGALGGLVGGFGGGLLFDPISVLTEVGGHGSGALSRAIGLTVVGLCAGLGIGVVEEIRKQGWLLIMSGPLAGKQFILYREQTTLGSSPKCDIVLPKDPAVQPQHPRLSAERRQLHPPRPQRHAHRYPQRPARRESRLAGWRHDSVGANGAGVSDTGDGEAAAGVAARGLARPLARCESGAPSCGRACLLVLVLS